MVENRNSRIWVQVTLSPLPALAEENFSKGEEGLPLLQRYPQCSHRLFLLEKQPGRKHFHSGSSMLPPLAIEANGLKNCVKGWNATHDVKVELQFVPAQDYFGGSKLPTAFASGPGPDIFIISPGDFLRYYNGGVLVDLTPYMEDAAKKDFFPSVMEGWTFGER